MAEPTIRDVARLAGVSVASVSRTLNSLGNVGEATREQVMAAVAQLGYVPHAAARSLSLARTHAIGVVLPDLHGEFFSECVRGMDREAHRLGYSLLLSNLHDDNPHSVEMLRAMRGRVDGLLVMAPHLSSSVLDTVLPRALPMVLINCPEIAREAPTMRLDNEAGVEAILGHLVQSGRRHIVHIAGADENLDARERRKTFVKAMHRHFGDADPQILPGDFSEEAGEAAADAILASTRPCDAVFAANDMMALGCLRVLRRAGRRVPEDIAIAGFDDIPLARFLDLTTVRVKMVDLGARAVDRLIEMLEGRADDRACERFGPELVMRATTLSDAPRHALD